MRPGTPLAHHTRLHLQTDACLAVRSAGAACRACESICPTTALRVADAPQLTGDCLDCGRCAGACPTGALNAAGFDSTLPLPDGNSTIRIECWMVVPGLAHSHSVRVPCAGGVSPGRWLAWVEAAAPARLEVVDRGWCEACPAGGTKEHVASPALASVREWLNTAGMPAASQPGIVSAPLDPALRPAAFPRPVDAETLSRRDFFRRAAKRPHHSAGAAAARPTSLATIRRTAPLQAEHTLRLNTLDRIARRHGGSVHPQVLPSLSIASDCAGHGVCAGSCPTGALRLVSGSAAEGLAFNAAACVACGLCERLCPEQALRVDRSRPGSAEFKLMHRRALRACPGCGANHTGSTPLCPRCNTAQHLAHDLFSPAGHNRQAARSSTEVPDHE